MSISRHFVFALTFVFALATGLSSCGENTESVPKEMIPMSTMAELLADIELAEGMILNSENSASYFDSLRARAYYSTIFSHHQVTDSVFYRSWIYYQQHPSHGLQLYEQVLDILRKQEEQ